MCEIPDEPLIKQLHGENPNEPHVVFQTEFFSKPHLVHKTSDGARVEDAVLLYPPGSKQFAHVVERHAARVEEARRIWSAIGLLLSCADGFRNQTPRRALEQVLLVKHSHL